MSPDVVAIHVVALSCRDPVSSSYISTVHLNLSHISEHGKDGECMYDYNYLHLINKFYINFVNVFTENSML